MLRLLAEVGADLALPTREGCKTAAQLAEERRHPGAVQLLKQLGHQRGGKVPAMAATGDTRSCVSSAPACSRPKQIKKRGGPGGWDAGGSNKGTAGSTAAQAEAQPGQDEGGSLEALAEARAAVAAARAAATQQHAALDASAAEPRAPQLAAAPGTAGSDGGHRECRLCMEPAAQLEALVPCGHCITCQPCTKRLLAQPTQKRVCPLCRAQVRAQLAAPDCRRRHGAAVRPGRLKMLACRPPPLAADIGIRARYLQDLPWLSRPGLPKAGAAGKEGSLVCYAAPAIPWKLWDVALDRNLH